MTKWFKRIVLGALVLALVVWGADALLLRMWSAKPPPMPRDTSILSRTPEPRAGKVWLGNSWAGYREGLRVVHLKGTPFEMGYAHGLLLQEQMHTLENEFFQMIRGYVPRHWVVEVLMRYILYRNRHLSEFVPEKYRMEIFGETFGCPDIHGEEGPFYNRLLNYHAAHDVSYMMIDNPLVARAGCTAFGAWGSATGDGHLLTGRNFDWEAADVFGRDRVVILCEPDGGIPFVSLSWAGMVGVVSGMNRAGISVTINGAPSELPGEIGTPAALVARDILERAHNLAEAETILREARVFVSTLWLIGSRADGRFVVVEKTPETMHVREPDGERIVCANHFQTDGLKDMPRNTAFSAESTSVVRASRLSELLDGPVTVERVVEILRDRKLAGGQFAGNGHRSSLNAFIATHSTAMDLSAGVFWAASPPHQLGKFVAFDVNDFDRELPDQSIPADPAAEEFRRYEQSQTFLTEGQHALKHGDAADALSKAGQAETLNPGFYQNAALQGRALLALGRTNDAMRAISAALAGKPAFAKERKELEALIHER